MILSSNEVNEKFNFNKAVFPGIQGGPLMHVIAAKAVCFKEALDPSFKTYQGQIVKNAKALAESLMKRGFRLVSGGTDNHLMLVDLRNMGVTGKALRNCWMQPISPAIRIRSLTIRRSPLLPAAFVWERQPLPQGA